MLDAAKSFEKNLCPPPTKLREQMVGNITLIMTFEHKKSYHASISDLTTAVSTTEKRPDIEKTAGGQGRGAELEAKVPMDTRNSASFRSSMRCLCVHLLTKLLFRWNPGDLAHLFRGDFAKRDHSDYPWYGLGVRHRNDQVTIHAIRVQCVAIRRCHLITTSLFTFGSHLPQKSLRFSSLWQPDFFATREL
eukprot:gnl/TRDRNA2_/TRDRNA2_175579_c7_seq5.p1 gnl/TRDRNA2_/TRDRNA2_175579_c7~~gnl/TRDRNA2_/TRDRNA2_175579_c7_seq5.p1  ORF type:complete len:191 (+),score=14.86 gnl/TRDRNA2_/TRDRNA2_175579_c7_seq5:323-895(+)